jgi:hypothetical protein
MLFERMSLSNDCVDNRALWHEGRFAFYLATPLMYSADNQLFEAAATRMNRSAPPGR